MTVEPAQWLGKHTEESGIVLAGLLIGATGLVFQDTLGVTSMLTAVGIALVVAGTAYLIVEGTEAVRLSLAFGALVAAQLLPFGGVVGSISALLLVALLLVAVYSRS